jgi:hypothetical protein
MELTLDIFRNDAFSVTSLRRQVSNTPFIPRMLGEMALFDSKPINTRNVLLYEEDGNIRLIPVTEVGSPDVQQIRDRGRLRALSTVRLAKMDTVRASELLGVANMALPEDIRMRNAIDLVNKRMSKLKSDMEATKELHRLGALQGKLLDADGTTVIYDYFAEYGIATPPVLSINFSTTSENDLMMYFQENVYVPMQLALKNRAANGFRVGALVGDYYWGRLMRHPGFRKIYEYEQQAIAIARAANPLVQPNNWQQVDFAGITWINYRGSTSGDIAIPSNTAKFFPIGAQDVFDVYWSPGETLLDITSEGRPEYPYIQPDVRDQMPAHVDIHLRAYPLYACIFPKALIASVATG